MYTRENMEKMGEIYHSLLYVMNKQGHDPYSGTSDIFPFKCFALILPRAKQIGIPAALERKIGAALESVDVDDMKNMNEPCPMELRMNWWKGYQKVQA